MALSKNNVPYLQMFQVCTPQFLPEAQTTAAENAR
jgi:hypothetical protein